MAYPKVFGLEHGSAISLMMDSARGGYFEEVPVKYPDTGKAFSLHALHSIK